VTTEWKDITDPEELFRLKREGWEIEVQVDAGNDKYCPWRPWKQETWSFTYLFRARTPKPKAKMVKFLGWVSESGLLVEIDEAMCTSSRVEHYRRVPSRDFEAEVIEE
jgi:hypothetical protein